MKRSLPFSMEYIQAFFQPKHSDDTEESHPKHYRTHSSREFNLSPVTNTRQTKFNEAIFRDTSNLEDKTGLQIPLREVFPSLTLKQKVFYTILTAILSLSKAKGKQKRKSFQATVFTLYLTNWPF